MAKEHRAKMKRQLVQSYTHLENSYYGIIYLHGLFDESHPEMAEALVAAAQTINIAQGLLESFSNAAWSMTKESFDSYK